MLTIYRFILLLSPLVFLTNAGPANLKYSGSATDIRSDKFYYTEEHEEITVNGTHKSTRIVYRDQSGKIIVRKTIDYTNGYVNPSFKQEDLRDGYMEGAEVSGKTVKIIYKKSSRSALKTKTILVEGALVVDGGFNYFVKQNWGKILKGAVVKFNFIVPSQMDYFLFRVKKDSEKIYNGKKIVVCRMESDNILIRSLLDPVILTYDAQTLRLMQYEGISNINDTNGKSYLVKITYPTVGP